MSKSKKRASSSKSNSFPLLQVGLLLIAAGPLAYLFLATIWPLEPPLTNEQRGQAFGRGLVSVLSLVAGVVMVVLHFVRKR